MIRNPKQAGSLLYDCVPQRGPCPNRCNQCFYNRPGAFFADIREPHVPDPAELPEGAIVRMNSGHDSNLHRGLVLEAAAKYPRVFFNTSIPKLDFPGPVVLTVNPHEEQPAHEPGAPPPDNLMFVRIRVSPSNCRHVFAAAMKWTRRQVPCVLTFMRYYDAEVPEAHEWGIAGPTHELKRHISNEYWCPTERFMRTVLHQFERERLVTMCGTPTGGLCRDCRNCETFYWQAMKRLTERAA